MGRARILMLALITVAIVGMYGCGAEPLDEMGVKYYISNIRVLDGTTDNNFSIDPTAMDDDATIAITLASREGTYDLFIEEVILVILDELGFSYTLTYEGGHGDWLFSKSTFKIELYHFFDKGDYLLSVGGPEGAALISPRYRVDITIRGSFSKGNGVDLTLRDSTFFTVRVPAEEEEEEEPPTP